MATHQPTATTTTRAPQTTIGDRPNPLPAQFQNELENGVDYVRHCIRENPEAAALWCLGIGFVLGWKLKPW